MKYGLLALAIIFLVGCEEENYGWSDCDEEMMTMYVETGVLANRVKTSVQREEPFHWTLDDDASEPDWYVTQTFEFDGLGRGYELTFTSTGGECFVAEFDLP